MQLLSILTALAATSGLALADSSTWTAWSGPPTTTVTLTLLHANQTTTMTSYSATGTGHVVANLTTSAYSRPTTPAGTSTSAAIATFSSGAATLPEANVVVAAIAGVGAVACGLL